MVRKRLGGTKPMPWHRLARVGIRQCHNAFPSPRVVQVRTRSQILDEIQTIVADTLDWRGTISETSNLVQDLGLDSLRALTLVIEIENRLRIRLAPEDEAALVTVGDLLTVIERRLAQAGETL